MSKTQATICPECGAHLDPGETCDCAKKEPDGGNRAAPRVKTQAKYTTPARMAQAWREWEAK